MLRQYIYLSDAKADMLVEQLGRNLNGVAAELRISLKVISGSIRKDVSPATRYQRMAVLERYIERHQLVNDVESREASDYIRGTMKMHWGPLDGGPMVLFIGRTRDMTVGLGGSSKHVIGQESLGDPHAWSALPSIQGVLGEHISGDPALAQAIRDIRARRSAGSELAAAVLSDGEESSLVSMDGVWAATASVPLPVAEQVDFLAIPLVQGEIKSSFAPEEHLPAGHERPAGRPIHVTIGTPLYVARSSRGD